MAWTEELARYAFVGAVFFGAVIALRERQHVAMDVVFKALPAKAKNILSIIIPMVCLIIVIILLLNVPDLLRSSVGARSIVMSVPMVAIYSIWPVSGLFMVLHLIDLVWKAWKEMRVEKKY
jgi:TRAP-type C4-dicarboxylate transport system permease small subunit